MADPPSASYRTYFARRFVDRVDENVETRRERHETHRHPYRTQDDHFDARRGAQRRRGSDETRPTEVSAGQRHVDDDDRDAARLAETENRAGKGEERRPAGVKNRRQMFRARVAAFLSSVIVGNNGDAINITPDLLLTINSRIELYFYVNVRHTCLRLLGDHRKKVTRVR